ncbi:MAG TPA: ferritin-like domain-containing protein [Mucilaginibacter sp.]|nr:ferritin-like domain-containing protein [Mucilaginibacter sp.]
MNLFNVIEEIEKVDPEVVDRMSPRRAAIKNITSFGSKVALAAMPMALATMFKRAYGADTPVAVNDVLNFALKLEYLESYFYNQGAAQAGLIPSNNSGYFAEIQSDENQHVAFLKSVLGSAAVDMPAFDLTAGGAFPTVLSNYDTFLAVSNVFEDTGVRAYKGQAPNLLGNKVVLGAALAIHAVEARHASVVRQIRASRGVDISAWITGSASVANDTGIGAAVDGNYKDENNVMQGGVDVTKLPSATGSSTAYNIAVEAFDEPLDMATVLTLVGPFFK